MLGWLYKRTGFRLDVKALDAKLRELLANQQYYAVKERFDALCEALQALQDTPSFSDIRAAARVLHAFVKTVKATLINLPNGLTEETLFEELLDALVVFDGVGEWLSDRVIRWAIRSTY